MSDTPTAIASTIAEHRERPDQRRDAQHDHDDAVHQPDAEPHAEAEHDDQPDRIGGLTEQLGDDDADERHRRPDTDVEDPGDERHQHRQRGDAGDGVAVGDAVQRLVAEEEIGFDDANRTMIAIQR